MKTINKEQINEYLDGLKNIDEEIACNDCRLADDCDHGKGLCDTEDIFTFKTHYIVPEVGDMYLTKREVEALKERLGFIYECTEDAEIAKEGLQLASVIDYILQTQVMTKEDLDEE